MPSNKHNSITAKATDLISSLFDVTLARKVPFWHTALYNAFFMDLPVSYFVSHSSLPTVKRKAKSVNLVVACNGFPS